MPGEARWCRPPVNAGVRAADARHMAGRTGQRSNRSSALIAGALSVALFGGAAVANPAAFDRAVVRATSMMFGRSPQVQERNVASNDRERGGTSTHEPDECSALVEALQQASPPSSDVRRIARAIEVVEANCVKNPKANGLLNALRRLRANAEKHAVHQNSSGRRGGNGGGGSQGGGEHGHGHGQGSGGGHGNGRGQGSGPGGDGSSHGH